MGKKHDRRGKIPILGSGFNDENLKKLSQILKWSSGHFLLMKECNGKLTLYVNFYDEKTAAIVITRNKKHWDSDKFKNGLVYIIVPALQRYVGPLKFSQFLNHRSSDCIKNLDLEKLERYTLDLEHAEKI